MTIAEIRAPRSGADLTGVVDELCVVVPAHNEQGLVGNCLSTLHHARRELRRRAPQITCRVVVVADACHDRTAGISRELGATVVDAEHRNVGAARRDGVAAAIARSTSPLDRMWLASTDADCEVPSHWLVHFVAAAIRGYHMVTGMVSPTPGLSAAELDAWKRRHRYVDGHPHIHGANLGFRADAYVGLGGWSPLRTGEDVALVERAERQSGLRILRSARAPVQTSARRVGRAPEGFADYLSTLGDSDFGGLTARTAI